MSCFLNHFLTFPNKKCPEVSLKSIGSLMRRTSGDDAAVVREGTATGLLPGGDAFREVLGIFGDIILPPEHRQKPVEKAKKIRFLNFHFFRWIEWFSNKKDLDNL